MMKKIVSLIAVVILVVSMISPALVRASSPGLQPDIMTPEMWLNLQYLVTSMAAGGSVQVSPGVAPSQIVTEYTAPLPYQSKAYKVQQSLRRQLSQAILDGKIDHIDASLNMDDLNNLVSYDWGKYVDLGYSVSADAIPDYVPDEFRAQLSYLNTWDDLNIWHRMVVTYDNRILLSGNEVDLSKFFCALGDIVPWYYDLQYNKHGLLYFMNDWANCYAFATSRQEVNVPQYTALGNVFYTFNTQSSSYGAQQPTIDYTNDRVKLLLNNDHDWGDSLDYNFLINSYNGYNDGYANLYPSNLTFSEFDWQGGTYSYKYPDNDEIFQGGGAYEGLLISDYNVNTISNHSYGTGGINIGSYSIPISKQSDDKLLDTIATLSEYMRNVDIYVGSDWSNAQPWYAEPEQPDISVTFPEPEFIDGTDTPVVPMKIPQAGIVDLAKVLEWLQSLFDNDELDDAPLTIDDVPEDCFPDPDNNRLPSPMVVVTPAEAAEHAQQTQPLENTDRSVIPGTVFPQSNGGLLWSLKLSSNGPTSDETVESTDSPVHVVVGLYEATDAFLGPIMEYVWSIIIIVVVVGVVIKLLHG